MRWRLHAQRLLVERGERDVVPQLLELVADETVDSIHLNPGAVHALWTLHGLGVLDGSDAAATAAAVKALTHPSAGVRMNAAKVLPGAPASTTAVVDAKLLEDRDAQVRLAGLLALADLPAGAAAGSALAEFVSAPLNVADPWLHDAAVAAAANNAATFLSAAVAGDGGTLAAPVLSADGQDVLRIVAEHYSRGGPSEGVGGLVAKLAEADVRRVTPVLEGLAAGWPSDVRPNLDERLEADLTTLIERLPVGERGRLVQLAGRWGSERLRAYAADIADKYLERIDDDSLPTADRVAAAENLLRFQPREAAAVQNLLERVTPQAPPELATGLVRALAASEADELGDSIVESLPAFTPGAKSAAVAVLLARSTATPALLDALDSGVVRVADLTLDQRAALAAHPDVAIRDRAKSLLERGGAMPSADREAVLTAYLPAAEREGHAGRGKQLFVKVCANCHKHGGEGKDIGPDLTGMAVHPKKELLVHILDPSRSVESNFRTYTLLTTEGEVLTGMLAGESKTAVELVDAEGKRRPVLREEIELLRGSNKSLMPEGFEEQLKPDQMSDLLAFLTKRGRYTPVDLSKAATIASDRRMFVGAAGGDAEKLIADTWGLRTVAGVPFLILDPQDGARPNVIELYSPNGPVSATMPRSASVLLAGRVKTLHLLGGVAGWAHPYGEPGTISLVVRLHYADGVTEDHELKNGEHVADYIRRVDVPGSQFAFMMRGQQMRYLTIVPQRAEPLERVEFVKGADATAPVVMAVTAEAPSAGEDAIDVR